MMLALAMGVDTFTGVVLFQTNQPIAMGGVAGGVDSLRQTTLGGAIMWAGGYGIMVAVMLVLALSWLRHPDLAPRLMAGSRLERARAATLAGRTTLNTPASAATTPRMDVDTDDRALADYNTWLQGLAGQRPQG